MILERAGDDLGRRCASDIDQHDNRKSVRHIARFGAPALEIALIAPALGHDLAAFEKGVADPHRFIEQPARIGAKVDDVAGRLAAGGLVDRGQRSFGCRTGVPGKGVDVDDPDAILDLPLDRAELDLGAGDGQVERLVATATDDAQLDLGARRAAHLFDRLIKLQPVEQLPVDMGDVIAGLHARGKGWGVLGRSDHLDRAILHRDRQAEPAVIAVGGGAKRSVVRALHVGTVRIERGEHAVDRALDQHMVIDRIDIIGAHLVEHVHEGVEFLHRVGIGGGQRAGRQRDHGQCPDHHERLEQLGETRHQSIPRCKVGSS